MPDLRFALVMRTVDRHPRPNYLGRTLRNLERAGLLESKLRWSMQVVDSGSREEFFARAGLHDWAATFCATIDRTKHRRTPNENAARALELGAETGAEWVVFLEDDLDFCAGWLDATARWLDEHTRPGIPVYVFYSTAEEIAGAVAAGRSSWPYPIGPYFGSQALAFRRADAGDLARWVRTHAGSWRKGQPDRWRLSGFDVMAQRWSRGRFPEATHWLASAPSFVQHIGLESAIHTPRPGHKSPTWPGREWSYPAEAAHV